MNPNASNVLPPEWKKKVSQAFSFFLLWDERCNNLAWKRMPCLLLTVSAAKEHNNWRYYHYYHQWVEYWNHEPHCFLDHGGPLLEEEKFMGMLTVASNFALKSPFRNMKFQERKNYKTIKITDFIFFQCWKFFTNILFIPLCFFFVHVLSI